MTVQLPAPDEPLRMVAVHAHPDDESSKGAGSTARYAREGVQVTVLTATGGERGDVLNPRLRDDPGITPESLPGIRRREMERAKEILGVDHEWLGFVDSGLPEGDPLPPLPAGSFATLPVEEAVRPLVEAVRRLRPHVMTTYDENGGYPHPDHIKTHDVSMYAFEAAADPDRYPELGDPWQVSKVYFHMGFTLPRTKALHEAILATGAESPYAEWLANWDPEKDISHRVTTQVPCAEYFPVRDAALIAHATQIDPTGRWFSVPLDLQTQTWPTEDYELARSLVDSPVPEDDLFAGVRSEVGVR